MYRIWFITLLKTHCLMIISLVLVITSHYKQMMIFQILFHHTSAVWLLLNQIKILKLQKLLRGNGKHYMRWSRITYLILMNLVVFLMERLHFQYVIYIVAHGAKKFGLQKLGDSLSINVQDFSMRGGWALKSCNTFFDYWVGSFLSSVRTGKCMSG